MKLKLIIGTVVVVSAVVLCGTAVYAYQKMSVVAETNDGTWVQSFTDNGNRCYVAERAIARDFLQNGTPSASLAISCVKD